MRINWGIFQLFMVEQLGKPYLFGVENVTGLLKLKRADCSEIIENAYAYIGIKVPDYSNNQYMASSPIPAGEERLGDVGFFKRPDAAATHHVGMIFNDFYVFEARGNPFNRIILRPRRRWEAWREFTGWRRLHAVMDAEKAV